MRISACDGPSIQLLTLLARNGTTPRDWSVRDWLIENNTLDGTAGNPLIAFNNEAPDKTARHRKICVTGNTFRNAPQIAPVLLVTHSEDIAIHSNVIMSFAPEAIPPANRIYSGTEALVCTKDSERVTGTGNILSAATKRPGSSPAGIVEWRSGSAQSQGGAVSLPRATGAAEAETANPPKLPRLMMITWHGFSAADMTMYHKNGIDTVFKILGATDWSAVESERGEYDFARLRGSLQLAKDAGLCAIPTISFNNVPAWFTDAYPESLPRLSDGSSPESSKISLAWLVEKNRAKYERHEKTPDLDALEGYVKATLEELQRWDNVIGVEIPWCTFAENFSSRRETKGSAGRKSENGAKFTILGGFDPWFKARWQRPEPIPGTWAGYKNEPVEVQEYWQDWAEQANGEAANILLTLVHRDAPHYLIVVRKHIWIRTTDPAWMSPDLGTALHLNERQFGTFLNYVKAFSSETGWKGIMFDNDAFFDKSKTRNSLATRNLVTAAGYLYMGEGENSEKDTWQSGTITNIQAVHPDAFAFVPAPGKRGENITNEKEQTIIRFMREPGKAKGVGPP